MQHDRSTIYSSGRSPRRPQRRGPWLVAAVMATVSALACAPPRADSPLRPGHCSPPPNVVLVLSDALRAANLSLYGYPRPTSPRLDALAPESLVFRRHLVNYPATPFSISQLFTGRLMPPLLMDYSPGPAPVWETDPDLLVLPAVLRDAGYHNALVSTHPWFNERSLLLRWFEGGHVLRRAQAFVYAPFEELFPDIERFVRSVEDDPRPFFLYVHTMDTHKPYERHPGFAPWQDEDLRPDLVNRYDDEIRYTDHWTGRLVDLLRDHDLLESTLFVFTSDHGEDLGELGPEWWNFEHGATTHRSVLHVPLVMRLPERCRVAGDWQGPSRHIDLAPTLLGLVHGDVPEGLTFDGVDLTEEILAGRPPADRERRSVAHSSRYWSLTQGDLELVLDPWERTSELLRWQVDASNYPRPVAVSDSRLEEELRAQLRTNLRQGQRRLIFMPRRSEPLGSVHLGISTWTSPDSPGRLTYADSASDDRWQAIPYFLLEAAPGEQPEPLRLIWWVAPGIYRLWLRFADDRDKGYLQRLTVRFLDEPGAPPVKVSGEHLNGEGSVDLGLHRLSSLLRVELSEPEGGVMTTGLLLGPRSGGPPPEIWDAETEAQLRALGYLR